ncbi:MAG: MFS transporter, partial [Pseudomonadota bacterium]
MTSPPGKPVDGARSDRRRTSVVLSSVGEVVEWFDFMIYLALAPILAKVFFPTDDPLTSLLATLGIFAAAYLARPLGAIVFGGFGDRMGRKATLVISALIMAIAKLIEGSLPSYEAVGVAAPVLFILARILSGLSLGGEFTGTFIMLFETAKPGQRAMTISLGNVMSGIGVLLASGLVALLVGSFSAEEMQAWGWRIPFYVGAFVCFTALAIRLWVRETP